MEFAEVLEQTIALLQRQGSAHGKPDVVSRLDQGRQAPNGLNGGIERMLGGVGPGRRPVCRQPGQ